jgi:hypothetical protein
MIIVAAMIIGPHEIIAAVGVFDTVLLYESISDEPMTIDPYGGQAPIESLSRFLRSTVPPLGSIFSQIAGEGHCLILAPLEHLLP